MAKIKKAIITDAGFASRYLPITKTIPKAMIPIGAKPVMQLCVEECAEAGIEEIIIVATPSTKSREIYEDYFHNPAENVKTLLEKQGKLERFEPVEKVLSFPKITVIEQDTALPYGNGSPIVSARKYVENEEEAIAWIPKLIKMQDCKYDNTPLLPYYDQLAKVVKENGKN